MLCEWTAQLLNTRSTASSALGFKRCHTIAGQHTREEPLLDTLIVAVRLWLDWYGAG